MSCIEDFQKCVDILNLGTIRRLSGYTKPGNNGWEDVDNKFIAAAVNLPSVRNMIIANAKMLKREHDIRECRKAIAESEKKAATAKKALESMGVVV